MIPSIAYARWTAQPFASGGGSTRCRIAPIQVLVLPPYLVYSIAAVDASSRLRQTGDQRQGGVRERACAREINVYGRAIIL
jgi:hypothetical protein